MRNPDVITIGEYTLTEILKKHLHWLKTGEGSAANLGNSDLRGAILSGANLHGANLSGADLNNADLRFANLTWANLDNTNLSYADLNSANLGNASLRFANLYGADLFSANLKYSDLYGADLRYADLKCANLYNTVLSNAKGDLIEYRKGKILTENIIGYKKCRGDIIVTLEIPKGATVFSINGNKCRTNRAKVMAIDGADRAFSKFIYMSYYVGDEFNIYNFNCQYNEECGEGIHFFMTREEAENYII